MHFNHHAASLICWRNIGLKAPNSLGLWSKRTHTTLSVTQLIADLCKKNSLLLSNYTTDSYTISHHGGDICFYHHEAPFYQYIPLWMMVGVFVLSALPNISPFDCTALYCNISAALFHCPVRVWIIEQHVASGKCHCTFPCCEAWCSDMVVAKFWLCSKQLYKSCQGGW